MSVWNFEKPLFQTLSNYDDNFWWSFKLFCSVFLQQISEKKVSTHSTLLDSLWICKFFLNNYMIVKFLLSSGYYQKFFGLTFSYLVFVSALEYSLLTLLLVVVVAAIFLCVIVVFLMLVWFYYFKFNKGCNFCPWMVFCCIS